MVNRDKPDLWKDDVARSVDMYNDWFVNFAPKAFRQSRARTTQNVEATLKLTKSLAQLRADLLRDHPEILPILRMSTCPPIARDRLIGLARVSPNVVKCMEIDGCTPSRMPLNTLNKELEKIVGIVKKMVDPDIFVWLPSNTNPARTQVNRAATIVADRLCGAVADPIIRNAQERRQLASIGKWLEQRGYKPSPQGKVVKFREMEPGTYAFRVNVAITQEGGKQVNIPIDTTIMPLSARRGDFPVLIEAKSAGDFTNTNKRRKEEAQKISQLRATYGKNIRFNLFLCGYFDSGYLGYEAAEGIDWVWEHRMDDLSKLGL
ncbi:MAG: XamI family restriction endonuclease [Candidatus Korobacteraceae bacterium]|jgi:type II restriction enzyme